MKVLAIPGSLRRDSLNRSLLRAAADLAPSGVEIELYDELKAIPPFDEDDEDAPGAAVEHLRNAVREADALLVATPEYNSSIPGQLKNALDWLSRPRLDSAIAGKPAAALASSKGMFGGVWAQAELAKVLGASGARVVESDIAVPQAHEALAGELDPALVEKLEDVLDRLAAEVTRDRELIAA